LVVYIGLGMMALKFGKTLTQQRVYFFLAIIVFVYIMKTAITKQAMWFLM